MHVCMGMHAVLTGAGENLSFMSCMYGRIVSYSYMVVYRFDGLAYLRIRCPVYARFTLCTCVLVV